MLRLHRFARGSCLARHAFTLVELLVVIAIIGILVALLLPAVQAAREAARRMSCSNQEKNLALGVQNYHDVYQKMPYLGFDVNACDTISWLGRILPQMEQQALYDTLDWNGRANDGKNREYRTRILPFNTCPSDQTALGEANSGNNWWSHRRGSYAVNMGNTNYGQHDNTGWEGGPPDKFRGAPFTVGKLYGFSHVRDGLSNTMLLSEVRINPDEEGWRGMYAVTIYTSGAGFTTFLSPNTTASVDAGRREWNRDGKQDFSPPIPCHLANGDDWRTATFPAMSYHPGGVNAARCDGSVQFVSNTIDINVWRALSTAQGGEALGD